MLYLGPFQHRCAFFQDHCEEPCTSSSGGVLQDFQQVSRQHHAKPILGACHTAAQNFELACHGADLEEMIILLDTELYALW